MKCKHNWMLKIMNEDYGYYYCSKCLAEAKQDENTLSYNICRAEREDEIE